MQNIITKKLLLSAIFMFVLLMTGATDLQAQKNPPQIQKADSLFTQKKYTEAFRLYENALEEKQLFSPAMLLKMAYIQEGLKHYSSALYYLNLYYLHTANEAALFKMEELAQEHQLNGYDYHDLEYFLSIYHRYHTTWLLATTALAVFLFALILYRKRKTGIRPTSAGIVYVLILALLFILINYDIRYQKGIIDQDFAYLMSDPSGASKVVEIVKQGHRVNILDEKDIWMKIGWQEQEAYIRKTQLKVID